MGSTPLSELAFAGTGWHPARTGQAVAPAQTAAVAPAQTTAKTRSGTLGCAAPPHYHDVVFEYSGQQHWVGNQEAGRLLRARPARFCGADSRCMHDFPAELTYAK